MADFANLKAVYINCSLKRDGSDSHTQKLMDRSIAIMNAEGVTVDLIHARDHQIAFGMVKDANESGETDDWPSLQAGIMAADIIVVGTPIWLGSISSVASLVIERLYAYSGDTNEVGQYPYYGKVAGCIITGNEDGIKQCARDILYALQHIGYTIPPQADCGWIGEVGPGPSYGDTKFNGKPVNDDGTPAGYDSKFTNKNTTYMTWNLMHMAKLLKDNGGLPAKGNTVEGWQSVTNATNHYPKGQ